MHEGPVIHCCYRKLCHMHEHICVPERGVHGSGTSMGVGATRHISGDLSAMKRTEQNVLLLLKSCINEVQMGQRMNNIEWIIGRARMTVAFATHTLMCSLSLISLLMHFYSRTSGYQEMWDVDACAVASFITFLSVRSTCKDTHLCRKQTFKFSEKRIFYSLFHVHTVSRYFQTWISTLLTKNKTKKKKRFLFACWIRISRTKEVDSRPM